MKAYHEFRDPIHGFVHVSDAELDVIDSAPVQRLRDIRQLALTSYIYPGATHTRFEHSIGVMELAGRIFDVVTNPLNAPDEVKNALPLLFSDEHRPYWRSVVRIAALCHDIGHLPFSHAGEDLFPEDENGQKVDHEWMTEALITTSMGELLEGLSIPLRHSDVAAVATGRISAGKRQPVLAICSEMVTGSVFGADRMDYLLRDSHHAGVSYGRFDLARMLETLRILPSPSDKPDDPERWTQLMLGIQEGGVRSADALLLARYFMFDQVFYHRKRRVFDKHVQEYLRAFLMANLKRTTFPIAIDEHLSMSDATVLAAMYAAARDPMSPGYEAARRIVARDPYRWVWSAAPEDLAHNPTLGTEIERGLVDLLGGSNLVIHDVQPPKSAVIDFPVGRRNGQIVSARELSPILATLPSATFDAIYVPHVHVDQARRWLREHEQDLRYRVPRERPEGE